ncbi:hypothetical protein EV385_6674 [Krasilnikovia cinnamomea]|uniref:Hemophore-related protein n=1 Tax=Krasilnikovia cinnamomea TaxID=349313 RepID=A0A4Q7Z9Y7_9ACTN|nr:hypothetical protein [Krasilnikovia cinnamomea]RZU46599.1 hypothetical protein EV385_6674 [Krasilnikovia cinnamomea]
MRAHTTRVLSLAAAGAAAAVALLGLSGCGAEHEAAAAAQPAAVQAAGAQEAGNVQAAPVGAGPEATFIAATAAHLCTVQSTVYDDPKAMADAYQATPDYPGLTKAQVTAFQQKLTSDSAFAKQLSTNLQQTCKPGS